MSPASPHPPGDDDRPLDAFETREFDRIVASYRRTARRRSPASEPVLRWRTVVIVLLVSSALAIATALLPAPANLWTPVALLVLVALASLGWAVRGARRTSRS